MDGVKCNFCKGTNNYKKGFRETEYRGRIQKYYCKDCKRMFTQDLGFYRMKNSENIVTMSIDMYISNLSSRKMRNQLDRYMGIKVTHMTISHLVRRITLKVSKFVDGRGYNLTSPLDSGYR